MSTSSHKFIFMVGRHLTEHNGVHYGELLFNYSNSVHKKKTTFLREKACLMDDLNTHFGTIR